MDERTEMRIHVGDNADAAGVEQVGGWFLRADKGPDDPGDVRDLGNTYQADLVVVRPGRPASTSTPSSASRPARSPRSTWRPSRARRRLGRGRPAASGLGGRPLGQGSAPVSSVSGTGIVISSPILILSGFLICLFAASSCSTVTSNLRAIFEIVSFLATM
jgi:hypothetical protein